MFQIVYTNACQIKAKPNSISYPHLTPNLSNTNKNDFEIDIGMPTLLNTIYQITDATPQRTGK